MTLTNTKDGIRRASKCFPAQLLFVTLTTQRAAEAMVMWPWSSSGVRSGLCDAASHPSGQNRVLSPQSRNVRTNPWACINSYS